jgi:hypothetical protein
VHSAILLTDGVGAYNNEHLAYQQNNWRIFTIGFGSADEALLRHIAEETGGEYNMGDPSLKLSGKEPAKAPSKVVVEGDEVLATPAGNGAAALSPDTMVCAFQHIRSKIDGGQGARCTRHALQARRTETISALVPPAQRYWTLTVSWSQISAPPSVRLRSPSGRVIDGMTVAPDVAHDKGRTYEVFRLADAEPGPWTVELLSSVAQQAVIGTADIPWTMPNRPPDVSGAVAELANLWPPNHRFVETGITGVTDPEGDAVTLTITGVTQDEPVHEEGSGNTAPDASGVGTARVSLRAERAGGGNGRVYRVSFVARDARGASAQGSVLVCVPHDQSGGACVDDGQQYDSTQP